MTYRRLSVSLMLSLFAVVCVYPFVRMNTSAAGTLIVGSCRGAAYYTIQSAVNAASAGSTVLVCPGVYPETVTVTKTLTLLGAQHGVDARTRTNTRESNVVASVGFDIQADNVTVDGFSITDSGRPGVTLSGAGNHDGVQILNDIIRDHSIGLYFNAGGNHVTVRFNLFDSNNRPDLNNGMGIYGDNGIDDLVIDQNKFTGHTRAAMFFSGGQVATAITHNQFVNDGSIILSRVTGARIEGNSITRATSDAIRFISGVDGAKLSCNRIENSAGSALRLVGANTSTNLHFNNNDLRGNQFGLKLDPGAYTTLGGRLDATNNWWGTATGPDDAQGRNPGGTGDKLNDPDGVVDYVAFRPDSLPDSDNDGLPDSCAAPLAVPKPETKQQSAFIYGIDSTGRLQWYRHDGAGSGAGFQTPGSWQGPRYPGRGWGDVERVLPGGGNIIYAISADGVLKWFQHKGFNTGAGVEAADNWEGPRNVGRGWTGFADVFAGGEGVIYVVQTDGTLTWYRHLAYQTGAGFETQGAWATAHNVGRGWSGYRHVFSGGQGVIYVIAEDGTLKWYRHRAYLTGESFETSGAWEGPKDVGRGWGDVQQVFSPGEGIIYAVMSDGTLRWFRHLGYLDGRGLNRGGAWDGPKVVGRGWNALSKIFALQPRQPDVVR